MKKAFYLFIFSIFLFACVLSNKEKDKGDEGIVVTSPAPESDAAPSTDNHISVDTTALNEDIKSETSPSTTSGSSESNNSIGSQAGKEMSAPPPGLDTVAVH